MNTSKLTRRTWCGVIAAVVLAVGLTACKGNPRTCDDCAPTPAPIAGSPDAGYPPPAPTYPAAPPAPEISQADLDAAKDTADLERQRSVDLEKQLRHEQDRLASAETALKEMETRINDLESPPAGPLPAEAPTLPEPSAVDRLLSDLRARSSADVVREGEIVIVRVTNGFRAGSDLLKKDVQLVTSLNATADALTRYPGATVAVVGHSDTDPIKKSKWKSNDELSLARAQRVAQVLASNGVDQNRISIDGRGAREPLIAPERSAADKARNRRVEIMIRL